MFVVFIMAALMGVATGSLTSYRLLKYMEQLGLDVEVANQIIAILWIAFTGLNFALLVFSLHKWSKTVKKFKFLIGQVEREIVCMRPSGSADSEKSARTSEEDSARTLETISTRPDTSTKVSDKSDPIEPALPAPILPAMCSKESPLESTTCSSSVLRLHSSSRSSAIESDPISRFLILERRSLLNRGRRCLSDSAFTSVSQRADREAARSLIHCRTLSADASQRSRRDDTDEISAASSKPAKKQKRLVICEPEGGARSRTSDGHKPTRSAHRSPRRSPRRVRRCRRDSETSSETYSQELDACVRSAYPALLRKRLLQEGATPTYPDWQDFEQKDVPLGTNLPRSRFPDVAERPVYSDDSFSDHQKQLRRNISAHMQEIWQGPKFDDVDDDYATPPVKSATSEEKPGCSTAPQQEEPMQQETAKEGPPVPEAEMKEPSQQDPPQQDPPLQDPTLQFLPQTNPPRKTSSETNL